MKTLRQIAAFGLIACASLSAHAHRQFLLPSATVVSGNSPWITVDAAAASNVFEFDHVALNLTPLQITAPDGSLIKAENLFTGRFRSSFDVPLVQTGSYKISLVSDALMASYKENGEQKRWRGNAADLAKALPANATDVQVSQRSSRVETIVTNGKPGGKALEPGKRGLELSVITHPNDLVAGENASFRLLLDGKPVANTKVELIAGGLRYRQQLNSENYTTDADGKFSVNWKQPGMYWLAAEVKDNQGATPPATVRVASYVLTLEVLPQ
jgi:uncharacterized GH25 family protein